VVCHVGGFLDGLTGWDERLGVGLFDHSHEITHDLGEVLSECVNIGHKEPKNIYKK
jgi:hypothetical protein